jgi:hypothetical protein
MLVRLGTALVALAAMTACVANDPPATAHTAARSKVVRVMKDPNIVESSGLARSTYRRPVLWTHNDNGDSPRVFAIGKDGTTRGTFTLGCAKNVDWEDIASGPGHHIWVGDIGNDKTRQTVQVYRFREPVGLTSRTLKCRKFDLTFPGKPYNAEALLVNPGSGRVWIATKEVANAHLYRAPAKLSATGSNVLTEKRSVPAMVTAGSWSPDGSQIAIGTQTDAYLYSAKDFSLQRRLDLPAVEQGESLEYSRSGDELFRGSEGSDSPVWLVPLH